MPATTETNALSDYLNDHLADETFGVELVKRAMSENTGTPPLRAFLELLSWEFEEDRDTLVRVMGALGVRRKRVRETLAWIGEKLGRLKLSRYSPLTALAELESLHAGINGKLDMWNTLRADNENLAGQVDFNELVHRAERQAEELERRRLDMAARALSWRGDSSAARTGTPLAAAF